MSAYYFELNSQSMSFSNCYCYFILLILLYDISFNTLTERGRVLKNSIYYKSVTSTSTAFDVLHFHIYSPLDVIVDYESFRDYTRFGTRSVK